MRFAAVGKVRNNCEQRGSSKSARAVKSAKRLRLQGSVQIGGQQFSDAVLASPAAGGTSARRHFLDQVGAMAGALSALVIGVEWLALLMISPCAA